MFAPDLSRVRTPGNPAMLGLVDVASTLSTVSLVTVGFGWGWRAWDWVGVSRRGGVVGSLVGRAGPA